MQNKQAYASFAHRGLRLRGSAVAVSHTHNSRGWIPPRAICNDTATSIAYLYSAHVDQDSSARADSTVISQQLQAIIIWVKSFKNNIVSIIYRVDVGLLVLLTGGQSNCIDGRSSFPLCGESELLYNTIFLESPRSSLHPNRSSICSAVFAGRGCVTAWKTRRQTYRLTNTGSSIAIGRIVWTRCCLLI